MWFDVVFVRLPPPSGIRYAQRAALALPAVAMVVTADIGDPAGAFHPIHPIYKQEVGRRASLASRNLVRGESGAPTGGPRLLSAMWDVYDKSWGPSFHHGQPAGVCGQKDPGGNGIWQCGGLRLTFDKVRCWAWSVLALAQEAKEPHENPELVCAPVGVKRAARYLTADQFECVLVCRNVCKRNCAAAAGQAAGGVRRGAWHAQRLPAVEQRQRQRRPRWHQCGRPPAHQRAVHQLRRVPLLPGACGTIANGSLVLVAAIAARCLPMLSAAATTTTTTITTTTTTNPAHPPLSDVAPFSPPPTTLLQPLDFEGITASSGGRTVQLNTTFISGYPTTVKYGWHDYPTMLLFADDEFGLPVAPFNATITASASSSSS